MEEEQVHQLIHSILVSEKMENGKVSITNANVVINDGLMSEILKVFIVSEAGNLANTKVVCKSLNLIIKVAPTDPEYRKLVKLLYQSEIHFYEKVVPLFADLQENYTGKPITFLPKFYKASKEECKEAVILENLTPKGYVMLDRRFTFAEDYLTLVLKELGKFHALSLALQKHEPEQWDSLDNGVDGAEIFGGEVIEWFQDALQKAATLFQSIKPEISRKIMNVHDDFTRTIEKLLRPSEKYPSVIAHMDTWCNNFLFKHSGSTVVEDVVLIDFQQAAKASPVLDISCCLYTNGSAESISNWRDTLRVYYDSLEGHAKLLGCSLDGFYSFEMFLDDWKDYALYGMIKSAMGISMNTQDDQELKNKEVHKIGDSFFVEKWSEKTNERIAQLILHMHNENFF